MHARPLVLVVEDDPDASTVVETLLEVEGYQVLTAPHGAAALDLLQAHRPTVILLDMLLPVMDGWHFVAAYRALPPPHAPIVVMTAATDAQERARQVAADHYIGKPFEIDHFLRVIAHAVQGVPGGASEGRRAGA